MSKILIIMIVFNELGLQTHVSVAFVVWQFLFSFLKIESDALPSAISIIRPKIYTDMAASNLVYLQYHI